MDRRNRHFVPRPEGLEGRQLQATNALSTVGIPGLTSNPYSNAPPGTQIDGQAPVADTIEAKLQHIQNYPYFIGLLNKDGSVPQPTVGNIQNDLRTLIGQLHVGDTATTRQFNLDLRAAETTYHILPEQATALNRDFGAVLLAAGASPAITADLQSQMNALTQAATKESNPSIVARNEYAITLQLALGTGRPLLAPPTPALASGQRVGSFKGLPITNKAQPSLSGTYAAGVGIQIVDANGTVFGTATTDSNGNYTVKFANPLPNGTYTVRIRADDQGYLSPTSKTFSFVVDVKAAKAK